MSLFSGGDVLHHDETEQHCKLSVVIYFLNGVPGLSTGLWIPGPERLVSCFLVCSKPRVSGRAVAVCGDHSDNS